MGCTMCFRSYSLTLFTLLVVIFNYNTCSFYLLASALDRTMIASFFLNLHFSPFLPIICDILKCDLVSCVYIILFSVDNVIYKIKRSKSFFSFNFVLYIVAVNLQTFSPIIYNLSKNI